MNSRRQEFVQLGTGPDGDGAMGYSIAIFSQFGGTAHITQVFNDQSYPTSFGTNTLDGAEVYPNEGPIPVKPTLTNNGNGISFNDSPSEASSILGNYVSLNIQFTDYVRFAPTNVPGQSIFVTLGTVAWNVNSQVTNTSGGWVLTNYFNPILPQVSSTAQLPSWNSVDAGYH